MKTSPEQHDNELNENEDGDQEELAAFGVFFEALLKLFLKIWTLVECHKICKVQPGVAAVHQRLGENCINFPRLDENCGEHEGGAKAAEELEEDAGVGAQAGVEEQDPGDLAHQGASEQKGKVMQTNL